MFKSIAVLNSVLASAVRWMIILLMAAMTGVVFIQVIFRYLLDYSLSWSEELSRFAFIWLCFLGTAYLVLGNRHLRVTIVEDIVPRGVRVALRVLQYLAALFCTAIFLDGGVDIAGNEWRQLSPALQLPMGYVYLIIPIAAALMALWIVTTAVCEIGNKGPAPQLGAESSAPP